MVTATSTDDSEAAGWLAGADVGLSGVGALGVGALGAGALRAGGLGAGAPGAVEAAEVECFRMVDKMSPNILMAVSLSI